MQQSFGPVRMVLNVKSAKLPTKSAPMSTLIGMVGVMSMVIAARLRGAYRHSPYFVRNTGVPIVKVRELSKAERELVTNAA
jgi:hypothetical protein